MTIADKRKEYRLINILFKTIYKKKSAKWRGDYLRNKHIFHQIGNNVHLWGGVPSDPYLISIGNNVIIAVSVEFVTHDIFYHALNQTYSDLGKFYPHFDTITIEDNVCIGADTLDEVIGCLVNKNGIHNVLSFRGWHSEWNGILQAQYSVLFSFLLAVFKIGFVHFIHDAVHILRGQLSAGKKLSKLECEMLGFYFTLFSVGCCSAFNE